MIGTIAAASRHFLMDCEVDIVAMLVEPPFLCLFGGNGSRWCGNSGGILQKN